MHIREALNLGQKTLVHSTSPHVDARLLLQCAMDVGQSYLIAHDEEEMSQVQEQLYLTLLKRGAAGEPVPYLTGSAPFYGMEIKVSPAVLIPRPETEELVSLALERLISGFKASPTPHVVDVGTGSGCIAIALAKHFSPARISAVDISLQALEIARQNAQLHSVDNRVEFLCGSLLDPVAGRPDMIVANLPYIADHEWSTLSVGVKWYEPDLALRGGHDGLDDIRLLLTGAAKRLAPEGAMFLEIGWQQGDAVRSLAQSAFPTARVELIRDMAGLDRIVAVYQEQPV